MAVRSSFLLVAFACCVLSKKEGPPFDPCFKTDIACLRKATESFLENTSNGLPKFDIKPLDPLIIPELDVTVDKQHMGLEFNYKNINITGLKKLQISDFQMNTDSKSVLLKTQADIHMIADLTIVFSGKNKTFTGSYTASTNALGTTNYGYTLVKKGDEEYFELGPETHVCELFGEPNVAIDSNLQNALDNDPDAKSLKPGYESNKLSLRQRALCKIIETAFITVIHNIRAVARIFPKTAFFKDV